MRSRTRALAGLAALAAALFTGQAAAAAPRTDAPRPAAGKPLVVTFTNLLYNRHDLKAIDAFLSPTFVQHDPRIADGPAGLRAYLTAQNAAYPHSAVSIKRVIGEGNLIAIHSNLVLEPGTKGYAVLDLYRVIGGKIAEHWDTTQQVPASTVSGNDMFATLSSPRVSRPDPHAPTALNKQIATAAYTQIFVDKDVTAFDRYFAGPYYQHNPDFANGIQSAKASIGGLLAAFPDFHDDIFRIIADGDLAVIQSRATYMPGVAAAIFDIYRIRGGKIVEHWDIVQTVPANSANNNTML